MITACWFMMAWWIGVLPSASCNKPRFFIKYDGTCVQPKVKDSGTFISLHLTKAKLVDTGVTENDLSQARKYEHIQSSLT